MTKKTNLNAPLEGKQINELESTSVIKEGDLILVRNSSSGTDKKINYTDLVESIGNPALCGFTAMLPTEPNKIVIKPVNGSRILNYVTGMKISFISPINSTSDVKIKIDNLPEVNLFKYNTTQSSTLAVNDYVEAVFIQNNFYQVNEFKPLSNVYTNEYVVVLIDKVANAYTDIYLQSAFGLVKQNYYKGMIVNFICTEDTIGLTRIKIDGLSSFKDVLEGEGDYYDPIYSPLFANQIVQLVYNGQSFIKNKFDNNDPKIENLTTIDPTVPIAPGEEVRVIIPINNIVTFTLDTTQPLNTAAKNYHSLKTLFDDILTEYGNDGLGKKTGLMQVTVIINSVLNFNDGYTSNNPHCLALEKIKDVSWITIKSGRSDKRIIFTGGCRITIWTFDKACSFEEGTIFDFTDFRCTYESSVLHFISCKHINLTKIEMKCSDPRGVYYFVRVDGANVSNFTDCKFSYDNITASTIKTYCTILSLYGGFVNITGGTYKFTKPTGGESSCLGISLQGSPTIDVTIKNSTIISQNGVDPNGIAFGLSGGVTCTQINSTASSHQTPNSPGVYGTYWVINNNEETNILEKKSL